MDIVHDDRYLVFLRLDPSQTGMPDAGEQPLASCATYEEAQGIRRALSGTAAGKCVIRYVGPAGGGD